MAHESANYQEAYEMLLKASRLICDAGMMTYLDEECDVMTTALLKDMDFYTDFLRNMIEEQKQNNIVNSILMGSN